MTEEQYKKLEENQREYLRELMMANSLSKNNEISNLHSEILKKVSGIEENVNQLKKDVGSLTGKIESHDIVIKRVEGILPDIDKAIEAYRTTNIAGKLIIGVILGVPALAAFVTGLLYFIKIGEK